MEPHVRHFWLLSHTHRAIFNHYLSRHHRLTCRHRQNADFVVQLRRLCHCEYKHRPRVPNHCRMQQTHQPVHRSLTSALIDRSVAIRDPGQCLRNADKLDNDRHESPRDNQPFNSRDSLTINICVSLRGDLGRKPQGTRRKTIATANKVKCLFSRCQNEPESDSGTV